MFPVEYAEILHRIDAVDPAGYARSRNYLDGEVSRLSPYISRGVISTKQVMEAVLNKGVDLNRAEKFFQELAWRDYWQQVWVEKGDQINSDLKHDQPDVANNQMPKVILTGETRIEALDDAINNFYDSGYLHNHLRMYIAAISCNNAKSHWKTPAQWMYYHLKDGDWASNALSWQWVAGANSNKKYIANQENINKYCHTDQRNTFLDYTYEYINDMGIPNELKELSMPELTVDLPTQGEVEFDTGKPTLIYNYYNLDPLWHKGEVVNRVLLLEPSVFKSYPVSRKNIDFAISLGKNISSLQVVIGEFSDLADRYHLSNFIFKEHPLNNYQGTEENRDWMFGVKGYFPSFFSFWKKCKKELRF